MNFIIYKFRQGKKIIKNQNPSKPLELNNKVTRYKTIYPIGTRDNDINTPEFDDVIDFGNGQKYYYNSSRPLFSDNESPKYIYDGTDEFFDNPDLKKYITDNEYNPTQEFINYWQSLPISGYYKQYDEEDNSRIGSIPKEEYENLYNTYINSIDLDSLRERIKELSTFWK